MLRKCTDSSAWLCRQVAGAAARESRSLVHSSAARQPQLQTQAASLPYFAQLIQSSHVLVRHSSTFPYVFQTGTEPNGVASHLSSRITPARLHLASTFPDIFDQQADAPRATANTAAPDSRPSNPFLQFLGSPSQFNRTSTPSPVEAQQTPSRAPLYHRSPSSLEQSVEDPFDSIEDAHGRGEWPGSTPVPSRGNHPVRKMKTWQEMSDWLERFGNDVQIFPTEISRMWTHVVLCYTAHGKRGRFDERIAMYPDAPIFSREGKAFLLTLTELTRRRLRLSCRPEDKIVNRERWERERLRAPDIGRIMWATGKLKWRDSVLLRTAEVALIRDIGCPWNKPRYMTTAMWGAAWAFQNIPMTKLCGALQGMPEAFWAETNAQNACNLAWAMSSMRFRPMEAFADMLQKRLLSVLRADPGAIHPQNIGDMVQAVAVLRLQPYEGLLEECDKWMHANVELLLPNHILAYLNGLALLGELKQSDFLFFGDRVQVHIGEAVSDAEMDVFAHRVFVLAHMTYDDIGDEQADNLMTEFLVYMAARGRAVCRTMLSDSATFIENDPKVATFRSLMASIGYDVTIAPAEAIEGTGLVTPLLPEMYVRTRRASGSEATPANVGVQFLSKHNCFSSDSSGDLKVLGEAALSKSLLESEGLHVIQVFQSEFLKPETRLTTQQAYLRRKFEAVLEAGEAAEMEEVAQVVEDVATPRPISLGLDALGVSADSRQVGKAM